MGKSSKSVQKSDDKPSQKLTLTKLLRRLRPMLPGKTVKTEVCEYVVEGKCLIKLNYYCTYIFRSYEENKKREKANCLPVSISVGVANQCFSDSEFGYKSTASVGFKTRTYHKRQDGTFNLEAVAAAARCCVEQVDSCIAKLKKDQQLTAKRKKFLAKAIEQFHDELPKHLAETRTTRFSNRYWFAEYKSFAVRAVIKDEQAPFKDWEASYELDIEDTSLSLDHATALVGNLYYLINKQK